MKYVDISKPVDIPLEVAQCPECNNQLWVEITEWGTDEGDVTEGGFELHCSDRPCDEVAEHWPIDWLPIESKVYDWLFDNVRVADATEDKLKRWNESVKDFARCASDN